MTKTTTLLFAALAATLALAAGCGPATADPVDEALTGIVEASDRAALEGDMATIYRGLTNGNEAAVGDALGKLSSDVDLALRDGISREEIEGFLTDNANNVQPFCDVCASVLDRKRRTL